MAHRRQSCSQSSSAPISLVILTHGPLTGRYRAGESITVSALPRISRADVAHFIVGELAANRHVHKVVALAT